MILGALCLVALGTVVLIAFELLRRPSYDKVDPDYRRYSQTFDRLAGELAGREASSEDIIDLGSLNGGDWEMACVFGGYNDPLDEMRSYGADISEADQRRLTDAKSGFRLNQVEEYEMMIAYVDTRNRAHFIHFERGIGPGGQHLRKCISKPDTKVILDAMISLAPAADLRVKAVSIDADRLSVELMDGS